MVNVSSVKLLALPAVICGGLLLSACSSNDQYLQAKTLPPITVPESLDTDKLGQIYNVPAGDGRIASGELEKPLPPTLSGIQTFTEARVQTLGNRSWLMVPKEASATWSQLLIFLQSRRIGSVKQDVLRATIDTNWINEASDLNTAFRYQLHLESGFQPEITEIHAVNIKGTPRTPIGPNTEWPLKPQNTSHQLWLLKEMAKVINNQKSLGDSLIASSIALSDKLIATSVNGEPVLDLLVTRERAYQALQNSLQQESCGIY